MQKITYEDWKSGRASIPAGLTIGGKPVTELFPGEVVCIPEHPDELNKSPPPTNDGGPAFPHHVHVRRPGTVTVPSHDPVYDGMSLRDWFAGQALAGELGSLSSEVSANTLAEASVEAGRTVEDQLAFNCYLIADAMLKARA